jgi:hypothetical protein
MAFKLTEAGEGTTQHHSLRRFSVPFELLQNHVSLARGVHALRAATRSVWVECVEVVRLSHSITKNKDSVMQDQNSITPYLAAAHSTPQKTTHTVAQHHHITP